MMKARPKISHDKEILFVQPSLGRAAVFGYAFNGMITSEHKKDSYLGGWVENFSQNDLRGLREAFQYDMFFNNWQGHSVEWVRDYISDFKSPTNEMMLDKLKAMNKKEKLKLSLELTRLSLDPRISDSDNKKYIDLYYESFDNRLLKRTFSRALLDFASKLKIHGLGKSDSNPIYGTFKFWEHSDWNLGFKNEKMPMKRN